MPHEVVKGLPQHRPRSYLTIVGFSLLKQTAIGKGIDRPVWVIGVVKSSPGIVVFADDAHSAIGKGSLNLRWKDTSRDGVRRQESELHPGSLIGRVNCFQ